MYCTSVHVHALIYTYSMQGCIQTVDKGGGGGGGGANWVLQNEEPYVQAELNDMEGLGVQGIAGKV